MVAEIAMLNRKFGRLLVVGEGPRAAGGEKRWSCLCDCGRETVVFGGNLRRGNTMSCGCLHSETSRGNITHGMARGGAVAPEHACWSAMLSRCENPKDRDFAAYGGAGIVVYGAWHSFRDFYEDVGKRPSSAHSLDRYPNPHGNYEPGNVRWATAQQQSRNRRTNVVVQYRGRAVCLAEAAELSGIKYSTVYMRIARGWGLERVFGG